MIFIKAGTGKPIRSQGCTIEVFVNNIRNAFQRVRGLLVESGF